MSTAIVTDSTSDIPTDQIERHRIHVVPAILVIDGESFQDGEEISRDSFYQALPNMKTPPTTAAPSIGAFEELYENLFQQGFNQIISIHVASKLSGIINAAQAAARAFGELVHIVDSGQVTLGLGFQVLEAAEAAISNLPVDTILRHIYDIRRRVHLVAMLDTLEYLHRSGRVSWARASLGSLLQIKPFLGVEDGEVILLGKVRTRQKGIMRLLQLLDNLGPLDRLAILHTNAEAEAREILERMTGKLSSTPLLVNVTSVIGTHVGPNGLGFTAVVK